MNSQLSTDNSPGTYHVPVSSLAAPVNRIKQVNQTIPAVLIAAVDALTVACSVYLAWLARVYFYPRIVDVFPADIPTTAVYQVPVGIVIVLGCFLYEGLYGKRLPFWREMERLVKALTLAFVLVLTALFLGKSSSIVSRTVVVTGYILALALVPLGRYIGKHILVKLGWWRQSILIMGAGEIGLQVGKAVVSDPYMGYHIAGFVSEESHPATSLVSIGNNSFPILGGIQEARKIIKKTGVKNIVIAVPGIPGDELVTMVTALQTICQSVLVVSNLTGMPVVDSEAEYFFEEKILAFRTRNNLARPVNMVVKRGFDMFLGIIALALAIIPMIIIAILIRIDSRGPALYSQARLGRKGKEFKCFKFRTMYINNEEILDEYFTSNPEVREEWEQYAKLRNGDPRVTRIGEWLRRLSLDELPQLLNVMQGKMSLVGPRPYLPREYTRMQDLAATIQLSRPGITGLWQVSGRNDVDFIGRLKLDSWYVHNWSLWLDLTIMFRTVAVVLKKDGAY